MSSEKTQEHKDVKSPGEDFQYVALADITMTIRHQTVRIPSGTIISDLAHVRAIKESYGASAPIRRVTTQELLNSGRF